MAEAGAPAFILLAAFLLYLGWPPADVEIDTKRRHFVHDFMPAATIAVIVLSLAQFPLQLAATSTTFSFLAGLCVAWRSDESGD